MSSYFNFGLHTAVSPWERRAFLAYSQRIYGRDSRWIPPEASKIHSAIDPERNPHLARLNPQLIYFDGLRRQEKPLAGPGLTMFETPLVTGILLQDPRRHDRTAHLAHLHCANSPEAFLVFQDNLIEELTRRGIRRLLGPTGLSPHLASGALESHWNLPPPQHTPYNPPYLPEILARRMQPLAQSMLFHYEVPQQQPFPSKTQATLQPVRPGQLSSQLLPVLAAACHNPAGFAPPDALEANFWQRWLGPQLRGWAAWIDNEPVGIVLLLPDLAAQLRRFKGGRGLWRLGFTAVKNRPVQSGRVLLGGVLPHWRNQGIGQQLWQQTVRTAQNAGWQTLTIGPIWTDETAVAWLQKQNAKPLQTYQLYQRTF